MIADFHNDILTAAAGDTGKLSRETACCVCALFRGERDFNALCKLARRFVAERPQNLYLGLEDVGYFDEARAEEIFSWRPIYASLTWNGENALAGGCMSDGRLTKKGRQAVDALSKRGIFIDCAHLNRASFADLLDCEPYGLLDSHTCMSGVCRHPRNLEDWQAQEIVARGGLIGIAFVGKFLRKDGPACAEDVFRHIDYAVQKFGSGAVCIGSDFNGSDDLPLDLCRYEDEPRLRDCFVRAGYKSNDIDAVFVNNLQNFLGKRNRAVF